MLSRIPSLNLGRHLVATSGVGFPVERQVPTAAVVSPLSRAWTYAVTWCDRWLERFGQSVGLSSLLPWQLAGVGACGGLIGFPQETPTTTGERTNKLSGCSFMLMEGPNGSFIMMSASGGPARQSRLDSLEEFQARLRQQGYTEAAIAQVIAQLEWRWVGAQMRSRKAKSGWSDLSAEVRAQLPEMPDTWAARGALQYVSVTTDASTGEIISYSPEGDLDARQLAIFRPRPEY